MVHRMHMTQGTLVSQTLIEHLYQRYWLVIFNAIARQITSREEAEDVLIEVFLAAMESPVLATLHETQQLAWLQRTAYHKSMDYYRRNKRRPLVPLEETTGQILSDPHSSPEHVVLRHEELVLLQQDLAALSDVQQEVLILRFAHGLRCSEIAARTQKSEGAIRTLLSRTLNLLRETRAQRKKEGTEHE